MGRILIISDTHFNHENVIKYCNRPYANSNEMDEALITNWNAKVNPDDLVYHLGDFAFGARTDIERYRNRLNGEIILIQGNHDRRGIESFLNSGFKEVYRGELFIEYKGVKLWLTHRPHNETVNFFNIHGHVHNDFSHEINNPRCFNACVEQNNFTPVFLDDILEEYIKRGILNRKKVKEYNEQ